MLSWTRFDRTIVTNMIISIDVLTSLVVKAWLSLHTLA